MKKGERKAGPRNIICKTCDMEFEVFPGQYKTRKYCSRKCYELSKRKLSPPEEEVVISRYLAGESSIAIGNDIGVSHALILDTMRRAGIQPRKRTQYRTYSLREDAFDKIADGETAYWLGFIYADGYVRKDGLTIRLKPSDRGHIEKFLAFMGSDTVVKDTKSYAGDTVFAGCHSYHLAETLTNYGIVPNRGEFDKTVGAVPQRLYHAFLRGMIDGDGYITKRDTKHTPNIGFCGQRDAVEWVRGMLVKRAGASIKVKPRKRKGTVAYEIAFGGRHQLRRIVNWIYAGATVYLDRKKALADYWGAA